MGTADMYHCAGCWLGRIAVVAALAMMLNCTPQAALDSETPIVIERVSAPGVQAGTVAAGNVTAADVYAGNVLAGAVTVAEPIQAGEVLAGDVAAGSVIAGPVSAGPVQAGSVLAGDVEATGAVTLSGDLACSVTPSIPTVGTQIVTLECVGSACATAAGDWTAATQSACAGGTVHSASVSGGVTINGIGNPVVAWRYLALVECP